jgi:hypothetical protein
LYYSLTCTSAEEIGKNYPDENNCLILQKDPCEVGNVMYINYVRSQNHCFDTTVEKKLKYLMDVANNIASIKELRIKKCTLIDKAKFANGLTASYVNFLLKKPTSIYINYGYNYKTGNVSSIDVELDKIKNDRDSNDYNDINTISINDIVQDIQDINSLCLNNMDAIKNAKLITLYKIGSDDGYKEITNKIDANKLFNMKKQIGATSLLNQYTSYFDENKSIERLYFDKLYYDNSDKYNNKYNKYNNFISEIINIIDSNFIRFDIIDSNNKKTEYGVNIYTLHKCFRKIDQLNCAGLEKIIYN